MSQQMQYNGLFINGLGVSGYVCTVKLIYACVIINSRLRSSTPHIELYVDTFIVLYYICYKLKVAMLDVQTSFDISLTN